MKLKLFFALIFILTACSRTEKKPMNSASSLFDRYYEERMRLFPLEATSNGDNRYNDLLPVDISDSYRDTVKAFYQKYHDALNKLDTAGLNENDKISYQNLK